MVKCAWTETVGPSALQSTSTLIPSRNISSFAKLPYLLYHVTPVSVGTPTSLSFRHIKLNLITCNWKIYVFVHSSVIHGIDELRHIHIFKRRSRPQCRNMKRTNYVAIRLLAYSRRKASRANLKPRFLQKSLYELYVVVNGRLNVK
jgi:hypothetical protein